MASNFRTEPGIVLVNIEFDGLKKKSGRPPLGGPGADRTVPLSGGPEQGGSRGLPERVWRTPWLWQFYLKKLFEICFSLWMQCRGAGRTNRRMAARGEGGLQPRDVQGPSWSPNLCSLPPALIPFNPGMWPHNPHFTGLSDLP